MKVVQRNEERTVCQTFLNHVAMESLKFCLMTKANASVIKQNISALKPIYFILALLILQLGCAGSVTTQ